VAGALGRDTQLGQIEAWLTADAAPGPAGPRPVLVIEGEPGIGKTTLWRNSDGEAGNGTTTDTGSPAVVQGL